MVEVSKMLIPYKTFKKNKNTFLQFEILNIFKVFQYTDKTLNPEC